MRSNYTPISTGPKPSTRIVKSRCRLSGTMCGGRPLWRLATVLILSVFGMTSAEAQDSGPYNFIVILTDDQGWGTTSVMIDPEVPQSRSDFFQTPSLQRLVGSGMRFTQAYSPHPNCSPTRASIQTGRSPAALHFTDISYRNHGPFYVGNRVIPPRHISVLPEKELTIAELLKAHDPQYRAAHFGKWHMGKTHPSKHGYDASDGPTGNREGSLKQNLPDDPKQAFGMTRRATRWMREQVDAGHPFYLQVSHYATHLGYQSRPQTYTHYKQQPAGRRHNNVPFAAMSHDLDESIGLLLAAVDELGIAERTFIIYTADNGTYPTDDPGNINGPIRAHKATVWEGGVRVPLVVVGPGVSAGAVSRTPAIGWDILPTICDLIGAGWPDAVEGGSLRPVIMGDGAAAVERPREGFVFHWPHYQHQKGGVPDSTLLLDGWKLHYFWETDHVELYHLDQDLDESDDLAGVYPARAESMKRRLMTYLDEVSAQRPAPNPGYDPETDPAKQIREK